MYFGMFETFCAGLKHSEYPSLSEEKTELTCSKMRLTNRTGRMQMSQNQGGLPPAKGKQFSGEKCNSTKGAAPLGKIFNVHTFGFSRKLPPTAHVLGLREDGCVYSGLPGPPTGSCKDLLTALQARGSQGSPSQDWELLGGGGAGGTFTTERVVSK